jgi:sugar/nucleoside kinase (ribokinase family)
VRTLCLGEAIVDLVCTRPLDPAAGSDAAGLGQAPAFAAHPGGVMANVALSAATHGADVALAAGVGDDRWGRWLRQQLGLAGVGLDLFELVPGFATPVAFVTVDPGGEPSYDLHGDGIRPLIEAVGPRLDEAVRGAGSLCLGSNTMVGEPERALTLEARRRALELGRPVVLDANIRVGRWEHPGRASTIVGACVSGCFLVKANRSEARLLTGETDPERAAAGLLAAGARNALITLGGDGALLRGEVSARVPATPARVVNTAGAGDVLLGVLLALLAQTDFYAPAIAAALPEAVAQAVRSVEGWAAVPRP